VMVIHFRNILEQDLAMILAWRILPEVTMYMYTDVEPDMEKHRRWYRNIGTDPYRADWIINVDGEDVGVVSIVKIDPVHRRCEWGYYLAAPGVRGKGVGKSVELNILTYLFEKLGLNKLCCEVFAFNEMVVTIHQKYGSKVEGMRRAQIFKNGKFHDIVEMGILKSDWRDNIKNKIEYTVGEFDIPDKELVRIEPVE
jgi:UDP-4-amino-4,6-dideoxy-N-acetyl-beta-L-altrosamine N-acetyltransferase